MERAVTYSDHSTTVTTRYFTQAPHKSYGPMTQLLPGPQCPNVTHVPTVLLQTSPSLFTPPSLHPFAPLVPSILSRTASWSLSNPPPHPPFLFLSPTLPCLSVCLPVCLSLLSFLALTPFPLCLRLTPLFHPSALSLRNICLDRHPISELLWVLSTSCRVRMDV